MIRKAILLIIGLVILMSAVYAAGPVTGPVITQNDVSCGLLLDSNGNLIEGQGKAVYTTDGNGISLLTCKGTLPAQTKDASRPVKAVHLDYASTGYLCITPLGFTEDWHEVITPSGQVITTCRIAPNSP